MQCRDGESCKISCENESRANRQLLNSSTVTGRRTCLLAMAMVGVLVARDNARAEGEKLHIFVSLVLRLSFVFFPGFSHTCTRHWDMCPRIR